MSFEKEENGPADAHEDEQGEERERASSTTPWGSVSGGSRRQRGVFRVPALLNISFSFSFILN